MSHRAFTLAEGLDPERTTVTLSGPDGISVRTSDHLSSGDYGPDGTIVTDVPWLADALAQHPSFTETALPSTWEAPAPEDLAKWKKEDLLREARRRGIPVDDSAKKADILHALDPNAHADGGDGAATGPLLHEKSLTELRKYAEEQGRVVDTDQSKGELLNTLSPDLYPDPSDPNGGAAV